MKTSQTTPLRWASLTLIRNFPEEHIQYQKTVLGTLIRLFPVFQYPQAWVLIGISHEHLLE